MMTDHSISSEQTEDSLSRDSSESTFRVPETVLDNIRETAQQAGGPYTTPPEREGAVGVTMFDSPNARDDTVLVLLPREQMAALASQAAVRIKSLEDGRTYLGVVVRGPFALPEGLRPDAPPVVATAVRGGHFLPEYHGLVEVEIAGEERGDQLQPHRFRPLPNSPVWPLDEDEVRQFLGTEGNIELGHAFGHDDLEVAFAADRKDVLPRHFGVLGTTGGGKSTTVAALIAQLQRAGVATILLDTEGEYTEMNEPTTDEKMIEILSEQGRAPTGVEETHLYYLVGRACANSMHPRQIPFSPQFSAISPYAAMELLDLNDAQQDRFEKAIDTAAELFDELKVWDARDHQYVEEKMDIFDEGYPKMRISHLYDVARVTADLLQNKEMSERTSLKSPEFEREKKRFSKVLEEMLRNEMKMYAPWRKVQGRLGRIDRLEVFDNPTAAPLDYEKMLKPGRVSIIDLSDTDSTLVNNLVISDLLRGVQKAQDTAYQQAIDLGREITPVVIIIEEAHEFLSAQRIRKMPVLHQQVERIAKRGRKRRLGLCFVTQLPQHLPDEILGLVNNFVLHKIGDSNVVARLKKNVGGVDEALWNRLPRLAPGQAIVSLASLSRPVLTAMNPAPCKLRMVE